MKNQNVLIVEDNQMDRLMARNAIKKLSRFGDVHEASSVKQGLKKLSKHKVDFILLDYYLPDGTAREFLTAYSERNPEIPVFIYARLESHEHLAELFHLGAENYFPKSCFNVDVLKKGLVQAKRRREEMALPGLSQGPLSKYLEGIRHKLDQGLMRFKEDKAFLNCHEVRQLNNLCQSMKDYNYYSTHTAQLGKVNLNEVMAQVKEHFKDSIAEQKGQLVVEEFSTPVYGDAKWLGEVFTRLIQNSLDYKSVDRIPDIRVSQDFTSDEEVVIIVSDNGQGMEHELPLGQFYPMGKEAQGNGLGLAISKTILNQHLGDMWYLGNKDLGTNMFICLKRWQEGTLEEKSTEAAVGE